MFLAGYSCRMPYELLPVSKNQTTKSCSPELSAFSQGAEGKRFKPAVQIQGSVAEDRESMCHALRFVDDRDDDAIGFHRGGNPMRIHRHGNTAGLS